MRGLLSERMWIVVIRYTKMVEQFVMLQAAVSSAIEFVLGCSPTEAFWLDIVDGLVTEF
jgi:hypothetical protein